MKVDRQSPYDQVIDPFVVKLSKKCLIIEFQGFSGSVSSVKYAPPRYHLLELPRRNRLRIPQGRRDPDSGIYASLRQAG